MTGIGCGAPLPEPRQRRFEPLGFGGVVGVVGAGLVDRFGLGALDEVWILKARGEGIVSVPMLAQIAGQARILLARR